MQKNTSNLIIVTLLCLLGLSGCQTLNHNVQTQPGFVANYSQSPDYYLEMAETTLPPERQSYQLKAAGRYLQERKLDDAEKILKSINRQTLPFNLSTQIELLYANLNIMENKPQKSLVYLHQIPSPNQLSTNEQIAYYQLLAQANFELQDYLVSAESHMALSPLLHSETAYQQNLREIWDELHQLPPAQLRDEIHHTPHGELNGWLQAVLTAKQYSDDNDLFLAELRKWQQDYPQHPANELLPTEQSKAHLAYSQQTSPNTTMAAASPAQATLSTTTAFPLNVALLLPITGKLASKGDAVRNGYMAAYYDAQSTGQTDIAAIDVYDTNKSDVQDLYRNAIEHGATLVIGPLTKQNVSRIQDFNALPVPTLALNYTDSERRLPKLYQFALSPQDEARQVAEKAREDGYEHAIVIAPNDDWGQAIAERFEAAWISMNGDVVASMGYNKHTNLNQSIKELLNIDKSTARTKIINRAIGHKIESVPRRRQDADMIFLVASPKMARQIKPLLKFYYADALPVYATSMVYSGKPNQQKDQDLNTIAFCDTPWMLNNKNPSMQKAEKQMHELLPNANAAEERLYAFGFDAYTLSQQLNPPMLSSNYGLPGLTGTLYLGDKHQILRQLNWAHFTNGLPTPSDSTPT